MEQVNFVRTQVEVISQKFTIRLDRELTTSELFQEELATLRMAGPQDTVHILLNGPGGSDSVMKAFLNTMAQSEAHIITEIEGQCCSALTMIFLAGHEFRVSDDSEFMIHTASFGYGGKENNVRQYVEFNAKANSRLMHKYYQHYLTNEEIEQCIEGKDFWMDADEIMERLEKRQELFTVELEQEQEAGTEAQINELMGEPIPEHQLTCLDKETLIKVIRGELSEEEWDVLFPVEGEEGQGIEIILSELDAESRIINKQLDKIHEEILNNEGIDSVEDFVKVTDCIYALRSLATHHEIKYPHNIGIEKLREKVLKHLDSLED